MLLTYAAPGVKAILAAERTRAVVNGLTLKCLVVKTGAAERLPNWPASCWRWSCSPSLPAAVLGPPDGPGAENPSRGSTHTYASSATSWSWWTCDAAELAEHVGAFLAELPETFIAT